MNTNSWSHLPNAHHIDRILESLKTHNDIWIAADRAVWDAARKAARDAARKAARDAARKAAWNAVWDAARKAARDAAWNAAGIAIMALIAWDDSARFLDMTGDELEVWVALSEDPQAILLLPAVRVFEQISKLEAA